MSSAAPQSLRSSVDDVKKVISMTRSPPRVKKPLKPVPDDVKIDDILKSMPKELFAQDRFKAYGSLLTTILVFAFSIYLLARAPWYVWPVAWILGGSAITGMISIGHDCMHQAFAKTKLVNDIMGTLLMLPLGYSFVSWKISHRYRCHAKELKASGSAFVDNIWQWAKGNTFWLASIAYWAEQHFDISYYKPEDRLRVRISNYFLYSFGIVFFSLMFWYVGVIGIVKYWLLPWLAYHVLVSTTTLLPTVVHDQKSNSIIHFDYPKWFEFLTNDITLTLPRNISTSIPHYKLRKAYQYLKKNWGEYITEIKFEWTLVDDLVKSENIPARETTPFQHMGVSERVTKTPNGDINPVAPESTGFKLWLQNVKAFAAQINYLHCAILFPTPIIGFYGLCTVTPIGKTVAWSLIYYLFTGLGITAGYHRLWAHKAYSATPALRVFLVMMGSGAVQGSIRWWCRDHRAHHRYTDTDKDPYNANKGFIYSHIGWMLKKQDPATIGRASIEDLNADPWIRWQHQYYVYLGVFWGVIFPTLVAGIGWGDWKGGYFYAAILRLVWVHHSTFFVNSLAHFWGVAPFADEHTPRDSVITALATLGEGYHNFHHEFPHDYRNAIKFYQYDPTKWFINTCYYLGLAYDLKIFDENVVLKGQVQMRQKILDRTKEKVHWGVPATELPLVGKQVFDQLQAEGYKLIIVEGFVHDITEFIQDHPGGSKILNPYVGKDATTAFTGGVYYHSNAARNLLEQYRVGQLDQTDDWSQASQVVPYDEFPARRPKKD